MITYYEHERIDVVVLEKAKAGNSICGDAHTVIHTDEYTVCGVVDGLGSGEGALQSSVAVTNAIELNHDRPVEEIVKSCNQALQHKRGAVLTLIKIDYNKSVVSYCNYGNVYFMMHLPDGSTVKPVPIRGYLSGVGHTFESQTFTYEQGSVFVLYTDGVKQPPPKEALMGADSPKEVEDSLGLIDVDPSDDLTLLIGI